MKVESWKFTKLKVVKTGFIFKTKNIRAFEPRIDWYSKNKMFKFYWEEKMFGDFTNLFIFSFSPDIFSKFF